MGLLNQAALALHELDEDFSPSPPWLRILHVANATARSWVFISFKAPTSQTWFHQGHHCWLTLASLAKGCKAQSLLLKNKPGFITTVELNPSVYVETAD